MRVALLNTALRLLARRVHFPAGTQGMGIGKEKGRTGGGGRPEVCEYRDWKVRVSANRLHGIWDGEERWGRGPSSA